MRSYRREHDNTETRPPFRARENAQAGSRQSAYARMMPSVVANEKDQKTAS